MSWDRLLTFTIGPYVVSTATPEKAPAEFSHLLLKVAAFHSWMSVHGFVYRHSQQLGHISGTSGRWKRTQLIDSAYQKRCTFDGFKSRMRYQSKSHPLIRLPRRTADLIAGHSHSYLKIQPLRLKSLLRLRHCEPRRRARSNIDMIARSMLTLIPVLRPFVILQHRYIPRSCDRQCALSRSDPARKYSRQRYVFAVGLTCAEVKERERGGEDGVDDHRVDGQ